jgi:Raf kinase inhibitor-like YbhB/YbcL family protein
MEEPQMKTLLRSATVLTFVTLFAAPVGAQGDNPSGQGGPPALAKSLAPARLGGRILVTSPAFTSGKTLDEKYTQNGANMSPPLAWTKGPAGTRSYVVLAEDSGVNRPEPIVHWIVYNIPSSVLKLSQEMPAEATLENGAQQGKNVAGTAAYIGPKPPAGQTHPYHFQVFALNTTLDIDPANADRATLIDAMKGRVLAVGDVVGNYTGQ